LCLLLQLVNYAPPPPPPHHQPISQLILKKISFKDDVTVILLLGAYFMLTFSVCTCLCLAVHIVTSSLASSRPVFPTAWIRNLMTCLSGPSEPAECCGSRIAFGNATVPTGAFHRLVAGPAFYLGRGVPLTADLSPPNRVLDLRLTAAHNDSLTVDLAWTAPGGDYDFGKGEMKLFFLSSKIFLLQTSPLYLTYFSLL
jgi:hypothetical protein